MVARRTDMMLSDVTVREYIECGKIGIFPGFHEADIRPVGLRLHLGGELLIPVEGQRVDPDAGDEVAFDRMDIREKEFILRPGAFVLGTTYESFQVSRDLVCHLDGRSTV